jgi:hypothetical protein
VRFDAATPVVRDEENARTRRSPQSREVDAAPQRHVRRALGEFVPRGTRFGMRIDGGLPAREALCGSCAGDIRVGREHVPETGLRRACAEVHDRLLVPRGRRAAFGNRATRDVDARRQRAGNLDAHAAILGGKERVQVALGKRCPIS